MTNEQILEQLDPELRPHFFHHTIAGPSIAHPLVYSLSLHAKMSDSKDEYFSMASLVNEFLRDKRKNRNEAILNKDWHRYVFLHERYARVDALMDCIKFNNFEMDSLGSCWRGLARHRDGLAQP